VILANNESSVTRFVIYLTLIIKGVNLTLQRVFVAIHVQMSLDLFQ